MNIRIKFAILDRGESAISFRFQCHHLHLVFVGSKLLGKFSLDYEVLLFYCLFEKYFLFAQFHSQENFVVKFGYVP